jgi:CheY-like chemotaxis protein
MIKQPSVILVVDDDFDIRDTLVDVLQDEGFGVASAADGQEALDHLRTAARRPDLILLDLMMPRMSGVEFRGAQLGVPDYATIPVVVFTADPRQARGMKANRVLTKPATKEALMAAVNSVLQSARSPQP